MNANRYHKFLRVSLLVGALLLIFDSGIISPTTKVLTSNTFNYVASVGVGMLANVPENEINSLSAQISEQQRSLDAREAALREREISARAYDTNTEDYSTYVLSVLLFIILVLLILNYAMDWLRAQRVTEQLHEKTLA